MYTGGIPMTRLAAFVGRDLALHLQEVFLAPLKVSVASLVLLLVPAVLCGQGVTDLPPAPLPARPASSRAAAAVTFTDIGAGLPGVAASSVAWGDFDNDGDLDLALTGQPASAGPMARVYRNDGGTFQDIGAGLVGVYYSSVAWGDYDGDGDVDLLVTGFASGGMSPASIYRNNGGAGFTDIGANLAGVWTGSVAWGDYDNDGDLDALIVGQMGVGSNAAMLYRNDGAVAFTSVGTALPAVNQASVAWGDYDNDGDLDVAITGQAPAIIARIYRNDGAAVFTDIGAGLAGVRNGAVAWGDYDSDGDLDLALTGAGYSRVYRNDGGGVFVDLIAGLPGLQYSSLAWGDYDNDGDLDLVLAGTTTGNRSGAITRVYRNDGGGVFTDANAGLPGVDYCSVAWGDYDSDGDLDLLLAGEAAVGYLARVFRNDGAPANTPPQAPGGLSALWLGDRVTLTWSASTDDRTPGAGLSYNLRIGTTPGGSEISAAMANAATGSRQVAQLGSAQKRTSWTVKLPPSWSTLYWSAQALDGSYAGSPFAAEQSLANPAAVAKELPKELSLALASANPAPGQARFRLSLPERARIRLSIHDVAGRRVATLLDGEREAGVHTVSWDFRGEIASRSPGVYFARLVAEGRTFTRRVVVLK